jgi:hypothetical protein
MAMAKRPKLTVVETDALSAEIRARARVAGSEAIAELVLLACGAQSESVKLAAIKELLDRGFGRPAAAPAENADGVVAHLLVDDGYAH